VANFEQHFMQYYWHSSFTNKDIGDHQCGFHLNRSTTEQFFFCIRQMLQKEVPGRTHRAYLLIADTSSPAYVVLLMLSLESGVSL
jgi:hypothetical protein